MDINDVIGKRLEQIVGKGAGAKFCKEMSKDVGEEWTKQTYYDALHGHRIFRVSELIALARAAGVQASELLDAKAAGVKKVTISRRHAPTEVSINAADLLDLFRAPGKAQGPMWRALHENRAILGELPALLAASREVEKELRIFFPQLPAFQEDPT